MLRSRFLTTPAPISGSARTDLRETEDQDQRGQHACARDAGGVRADPAERRLHGHGCDDPECDRTDRQCTLAMRAAKRTTLLERGLALHKANAGDDVSTRWITSTPAAPACESSHFAAITAKGCT
jgi:hypothetical protein